MHASMIVTLSMNLHPGIPYGIESITSVQIPINDPAICQLTASFANRLAIINVSKSAKLIHVDFIGFVRPLKIEMMYGI